MCGTGVHVRNHDITDPGVDESAIHVPLIESLPVGGEIFEVTHHFFNDCFFMGSVSFAAERLLQFVEKSIIFVDGPEVILERCPASGSSQQRHPHRVGGTEPFCQLTAGVRTGSCGSCLESENKFEGLASDGRFIHKVDPQNGFVAFPDDLRHGLLGIAAPILIAFRKEGKSFRHVSDPDVRTEVVGNCSVDFALHGVPEFTLFFRKSGCNVVLHGIAGGVDLFRKRCIQRNVKRHGVELVTLPRVNCDSCLDEVVEFQLMSDIDSRTVCNCNEIFHNGKIF